MNASTVADAATTGDVFLDAPLDTARLRTLRERFARDGYLVVRGLVPASLRAAVLEACADELRPYEGPLERVKPPSPAPHRHTDSGHVANALRSVHRIDAGTLPSFAAGVRAIAEHPPLRALVDALFGAETSPRESFFFDVNNATEPHRDTDFSGVPLVGVWCALVDVPADAGRFFVYPGSHRGHEADPRAAQSPDYGRRLLEELLREGTTCAAPRTRAGDAIVFDGSLVHGSLPHAGDPVRQVLTVHFGAACP